ncbi:uncharacterized protein [Mytilus edulis]|uniref:uncharacterized protein n=1 Tax=Mytilus edulis TaxID=6550 RepID=UPI0039F01648
MQGVPSILKLSTLLLISCSYGLNVYYEHLGCFLDSENRTVPYEKIYSDYMTITRCSKYCCSMSNYTYIGTEVGWECYCGNESSLFIPMPQTDCIHGCFGNQEEKCGGYWRLSIYKIDCPNDDPSPTTTHIPMTRKPIPTLDEVLDDIAEIQKEISVNRKETTAYKNTKVSAKDDRVSSKSIGIVGILVVLLPFIILFLLDIVTWVSPGARAKKT